MRNHNRSVREPLPGSERFDLGVAGPFRLLRVSSGLNGVRVKEPRTKSKQIVDQVFCWPFRPIHLPTTREVEGNLMVKGMPVLFAISDRDA
jgi:hypothetical protein